MKCLITTILSMILATTITAQTSSSEASVDNKFWYESREWKSDPVLSELYQSITAQYHDDLTIRPKIEKATHDIRQQWNTELSSLAASLGVDPSDAVSATRPDNPEAVEKFIELSGPINAKYAALLRDAESAVSRDLDLQIENAFIAAAKKYYQNSQRIQNK